MPLPVRSHGHAPRGKSEGRYGDKKRGAPGAGGPGGERGAGRFFRKKVCRFCSEQTEFADYKETERLTRFLTEKGKIVPRRITGNCSKHQRLLARAIKRARHSAFLAFQID